MTPATGEQVWEQIGGRFVADEVRQSRHRRSWRRVTSSRHQSICIYTEVTDNGGRHDFVGAYSQR